MVGFMVQTMTPKSHFEINRPLFNAIYEWFFRHCQSDLAIPYGIACICNVQKCNGMNKTALLDFLNQKGHPLGFLPNFNSTNQFNSPGLVLLFIALINQLLIL